MKAIMKHLPVQQNHERWRESSRLHKFFESISGSNVHSDLELPGSKVGAKRAILSSFFAGELDVGRLVSTAKSPALGEII